MSQNRIFKLQFLLWIILDFYVFLFCLLFSRLFFYLLRCRGDNYVLRVWLFNFSHSNFEQLKFFFSYRSFWFPIGLPGNTNLLLILAIDAFSFFIDIYFKYSKNYCFIKWVCDTYVESRPAYNYIRSLENDFAKLCLCETIVDQTV